MTGKRPDYTKVWDLQTRMRDINPDILTIPHFFGQQGYTTLGIGKIHTEIFLVVSFLDKIKS